MPFWLMSFIIASDNADTGRKHLFPCCKIAACWRQYSLNGFWFKLSCSAASLPSAAGSWSTLVHYAKMKSESNVMGKTNSSFHSCHLTPQKVSQINLVNWHSFAFVAALCLLLSSVKKATYRQEWLSSSSLVKKMKARLHVITQYLKASSKKEKAQTRLPVY